MEQAQIKTCSHLLVFCADTDLTGNADKITHLMKKVGVPEENLKQFQDVMKIFLSNFDNETGINRSTVQCIYCSHNSYIMQLNHLELIHVQCKDSVQKHILKFSIFHRNIVPTILVPIGYPADKPMPKLRFPKEEIFF